MAISGAVAIAAAVVGGTAYNQKRMNDRLKAQQTPQPPKPVEPAVTDIEEGIQQKERKRNRGSGRDGTIATSPTGIQTGQSFGGSTLLGG